MILLGVMCGTSLRGGFVSEEPPMTMLCCFMSSVRFTPGLSPIQGHFISLSSVSFLLFSMCMLKVSCWYACSARNDHNSGFP